MTPSILNYFLNKSKIPLTSSILDNGTFITDPSQKANTFNVYFAEQCTLGTGSEPPRFKYKTNSIHFKIEVDKEEISRLTQALLPRKWHG